MSSYVFNQNYRNSKGATRVNLFLIHFKDENNVDFIYSPHLDLTGYGYGLEAAKESFEIVLEDFIDYTLKEGTLGKVLEKLGWKSKNVSKQPSELFAPSITSVIIENDYVSELFDTYPTQTFHKEIRLAHCCIS